MGGGGSAPRRLQVPRVALSRLLPRGPTGCNSGLLCSAPSLSRSWPLSFWAVDNPHTRKSCLLGPAHCSSPPPSPLPPPSSLLRLPASWPGARPATAAAAAYSCCRCCCSLLRLLRLLLLRPQTGCFNPTPAGTQPALPRKEGRGGRRKIGGACGRPGIPLLVGCCCHWSAGSPKRVAGNVPDAS